MQRYQVPAARAIVLMLALGFALHMAPAALADVQPNALFSDNAVLQQQRPVPVWGEAGEGEEVTVQFRGQSLTTRAKDGKWKVHLQPMAAGGPFPMTIRGNNTITLNNIMVGEVWLCSGQSNMQWPVRASNDLEEATELAADKDLRLFTVPRQATDRPLKTVEASWKVSSPEEIQEFSAVAFWFGMQLRDTLNVPVGLINTSLGGTPAEAWTSRGTLAFHPQLQDILQEQENRLLEYPALLQQHNEAMREHRQKVQAAEAAGQQPPDPPRPPMDPTQWASRPSGLYNAMIAPLLPYAIRGAIWYQGESNAGNPVRYQTLFPEMIRNWRRAWGQNDFPFLFVQLAPFMAIKNEPSESNWAELREAQLLTTRKLPNTAMAVITDAGDEKDIHPRDKKTVGERLALAARGIAYGEDIVHSGPVISGMKVEGNKVYVTFDNAGTGLTAKGGRITGFEVAGRDGRYHNAEAMFQDNGVIVWSPDVQTPASVRYGWADFPLGNIYNTEGLPATPFRTDGPYMKEVFRF